MASKGQKVGTGKPAAPKAAVRPAQPAPKAKVAAPKAEKPAPVKTEEVVAPPVTIEPVPAVEAAVPQEVETIAEPVVEAAEAVVEQVEAAAEKVTETIAAPEAVIEPTTEFKEAKIMETIETNVAKAQAFFADFNDRAKVAVEKSTKLVEEANEFAKGNLEAIVESGKITAKGLESFGQEAADYSRKSFETATAALKGMASVKSPTEFFKLQSDFFRSTFDSAVAETSKNTEALMKLAGEAAQPLSNRVAVAAEKIKVAA